MAGSHNLLFLIGLLLAIVCLAHSQSRRVVKRYPSVYRTREAAQNEGGEADDIGSVVDSMHKALLLLEHRIMNLETNGHNLYQRLEAIEAMLYSTSADEQAGEITEQPHGAGSNTSNDVPSGIKNYVPSSPGNASNGANTENGAGQGNNIGEDEDEDEDHNRQDDVVALLEDAEAAIAEAADILSNQSNQHKPVTVDAGKNSESTVNDDAEGDADIAPHDENSASTDKTPNQDDVMAGSDENSEQHTTGDVESHSGNPTSGGEVIPGQNDVLASGSSEEEDKEEEEDEEEDEEEVDNSEGVGKTEEGSQEEQGKTSEESKDGVDKRYGGDTQQRQTRPQNRSFRFHHRLLPYNRRVSIHRGD